MKLGAVVVTYNRRDQIEETVARLLAEPLDVLVVVDNGSTDGSRAFLRGVGDPRLDLIESPENIGGAGGFETGLRHMRDVHDPDWVILMDDDGRPEPGALATFRAADLAAPALVERNDVVRMVFVRGGLRIQTMGRALGRGPKGARLRVMNLASRAVVEARVAAAGLVEVTP